MITGGIPPEEVPIGRWKKYRELAIVGAVGVVGLLVIFVSHRSHLDLFYPAGIVMMALLAYFNGANVVSKAIATLAGSGVSNYRRAILYGSIYTVMGAIASIIVAAGLVSTFTKGLIAGSFHLTGQFALAALLGASLWVYLATRLA